MEEKRRRGHGRPDPDRKNVRARLLLERPPQRLPGLQPEGKELGLVRGRRPWEITGLRQAERRIRQLDQANQRGKPNRPPSRLRWS